MRNIRDILALRPKDAFIGGAPCKLARPDLVDLVEAIQLNQTSDVLAVRAWLLHRHLLDESGTRVFQSVEDAKCCPAHIAAEAISKIEELYNEGVD